MEERIYGILSSILAHLIRHIFYSVVFKLVDYIMKRPPDAGSCVSTRRGGRLPRQMS